MARTCCFWLSLLMLFASSQTARATRMLGLIVFQAPPKIELPDGVPLLKNQINLFNSFQDRENYLEQIELDLNKTISVAEAASLIYELGHEREMPQVSRCSKHVKMLTEPKYRTSIEIDNLFDEEREFDEIEQPDANMQARLPSEVNFNALKRMSIIYEALKEWGIGEESVLDFKVQKEFLECIKYYHGRHQRALAGMNEYIWRKKDDIPSYSGNLDITKTKFANLIKLIEDAENDDTQRDPLVKEAVWMTRLAKLIRMLDEAQPLVPKTVVDFIMHPSRAHKIEILSRILDDIDKLKRRCLDLEVQTDKLFDYRDNLMQLYTLLKANKDWVGNELDFVLHPRRQPTIIAALYKYQEEPDDGYEYEPDEEEEANKKPHKTLEELLGFQASSGAVAAPAA